MLNKSFIQGLKLAYEKDQIFCIIADDEFAKLLQANDIDAMTLDEVMPGLKF